MQGKGLLVKVLTAPVPESAPAVETFLPSSFDFAVPEFASMRASFLSAAALAARPAFSSAPVAVPGIDAGANGFGSGEIANLPRASAAGACTECSGGDGKGVADDRF